SGLIAQSRRTVSPCRTAMASVLIQGGSCSCEPEFFPGGVKVADLPAEDDHLAPGRRDHPLMAGIRHAARSPASRRARHLATCRSLRIPVWMDASASSTTATQTRLRDEAGRKRSASEPPRLESG